jgi:hypothetical protein
MPPFLLMSTTWRRHYEANVEEILDASLFNMGTHDEVSLHRDSSSHFFCLCDDDDDREKSTV